MEKIVNLTPLSEENQMLFQKAWKWLRDNQTTNKEEPQLTSDTASYHYEGLIGIDERQGSDAFPLGAIILEETLHYVTSSDRPASSADFSPRFLRSIQKLIVNELKTRDQKKEFQSLLIGYLWKPIEADTAAGNDGGT